MFNKIKTNIAILVLGLTQYAMADAEMSASWPLCGRIYLDPPANWDASQGCPQERWGNPDYTDAPLNDAFGPRLLGNRHDFHRGIDIPVANTDDDYDPDVAPAPVFSILPGKVMKVSQSKGYVRVRHYRDPDNQSCRNYDEDGLLSNCFHTHYKHLHDTTVQLNQWIEQGVQLGTVGKREANTYHLHFELSEANDVDPFGAWQRDKKNPLHILPYHNVGTHTETRVLNILEISDTQVQVSVEVQQLNLGTPDINRIELQIYRRDAQDNLTLVEQPGNNPVGTTPEGDGYFIAPAFFDFDLYNRLYTPKDSSALPFEDFIPGGNYEMLGLNLSIPDSYSSEPTLDNQAEDDSTVGDINGVLVANQSFNQNDIYFPVSLTFTSLDSGDSSLGEICVEVSVFDIHQIIEATDFVCSSHLEPDNQSVQHPGNASSYGSYAEFLLQWQEYLQAIEP